MHLTIWKKERAGKFPNFPVFPPPPQLGRRKGKGKPPLGVPSPLPEGVVLIYIDTLSGPESQTSPSRAETSREANRTRYALRKALVRSFFSAVVD